MAEKKIRGLTKEQELNEEFLVRDTRSVVKKFKDWISVPPNMVALLFTLAGICVFKPEISDYIFFVALLFFWWAMKRKESTPIKMPIQSEFPDPNQPHPATGNPSSAKGIFFLGNEFKTGKEVWLTNDDARQHFLVLGTTGAGKTESLIGFAANALMWGSGFLFCDGKGDVALFAKVYALARRFGREDDLLVLNFMTGNQDLGAAGGKIMSNTLNPFSTGSSDSLTQMIVSLMDETGGDGAMWKGRATAMLTGVMRALSWLRDEGIVDLNVGEIRDFMTLKRIIDLGDPNKFPDMPQAIRGTIRSYLTSLPGFQEEKGYKQAQTTLDQHGYLEMQFTRILGSLADVYGHIFHTPNGEVDMFDVVLNRRILVIMLPALEKSKDEIANLGKIVVATLKGMMGATLGSTLEGNWDGVVENRPTNSPSPFICILDEVGYYTVDGMALMAAQARSLGFTMVYASQDIPAMKKLNEKEAASIIANTNTKVYMRTEEADVTGKLAVDSAGRAMRAQVGGYAGTSGEVGINYRDTMDARIETLDKINFADLKAQSEGEMHITFKDTVVRAKGFYANPESAVDKKKLKLRANHFIKVPKPDFEELERARKMPEIMNRLLSEDNIAKLKVDAKEAVDSLASRKDEIAFLHKIYDRMLSNGLNDYEAAAASAAAIMNIQEEAVQNFEKAIADASGLEAEGTRRAPSRPSPVKRNVRHRVMIEGDEEGDDTVIPMDKSIGSSDAVMQALAAVNYDEDASKEDVENRLIDMLDPDEFMSDDDMPEPEDIAISDVDDAISEAAGQMFDELDGIPMPEDDEDDDGEAPEASNVTVELLSEFILDEDEE